MRSWRVRWDSGAPQLRHKGREESAMLSRVEAEAAPRRSRRKAGATE
jgi:hypothetical protein